jgi:hypothetical protein
VEERRWEAEREKQPVEARREKKFSSSLKKTWKMGSVLLPVLARSATVVDSRKYPAFI